MCVDMFTMTDEKHIRIVEMKECICERLNLVEKKGGGFFFFFFFKQKTAYEMLRSLVGSEML